ncbi:hypothetical protein CHS0354_001195 [Potamilus streckersoni]|uniref:Glyoxylate reductase/hydroxypyruvate reductase n=1 Tax=Potamilus streckersoni TaxID=2493646 RepID=A0AAE0RMH6_9BIVA|nr:hypothetical protein CHS0354_001195 [Potamilus streckersoni]
MPKPRVFVTRKVPQDGITLLQEKCDVQIWDSEAIVPREELLKSVEGVEGIFCTINDMINTEVLDAAGPTLKVIGTMSVGKDHIDVTECERRGIYVSNTPDIASDSAAEITVALILITTRRLAEGMSAVRNGEWTFWKPQWMLGHNSMEKTLGIFGFGRVGFGVARRMKPFGVARIIYNDVFDAAFARDLATRVSFDELLSQSDILCLCCAVTPQTIGKFNKKAFCKMKNTAVLINTSRGKIVNHDDLYDALKEGQIAAAGLDVTSPEPLPVNHPLLTLPNCVILPHMGTNTWEARTSMSINTAKNILAVLDAN